LYGRKELVKDGRGTEREVIVDDSFVRKAIQDPGTEIVRGYPPVMPQIALANPELTQVMEYIKGLK